MWMIRRLGIFAVILSVVPVALLVLAYVISDKLGCGIGGDVNASCEQSVALLTAGYVVVMMVAPPAIALTVVWIVIELAQFLRTRLFF